MDIFDASKLIDTHCHLNDSSYDDDRDMVVKRAVDAGVEMIVDIGIDINSSKKALENSRKYKGSVYASVGVDAEVFVPGSDLFKKDVFEHDQIEAGKWINEQLKELDELLGTGEFVMVGECGMDYYWISKNEELSEEQKHKSKILQKLLFASQVELAIKHHLPLSIHSRGAEDECIEIIRIFESELSLNQPKHNSFTGSFHSFTGTVEQAKKIVQLGFKIGVNGIVTYSSADEVRNVAKAVGRENIVLETDGPFLVPSGSQISKPKRNEPFTVRDIDTYLSKNLQLQA